MPTPRASILIAAALATATAVVPAAACPVCNSGTGEQVRAGLRDDHLGSGVLAVALPFAVVAAVVVAIHFGRPGRRPPVPRRTDDARD